MHKDLKPVRTGKVDKNGHRVEGRPIKGGRYYTESYGVRFTDEDNWVAHANRRPRVVTRNGKVVNRGT